ncbi:protein O-mannosyl-transferase Tmtc3 [Parasteatoda tepidariorum]|uniref:protein O-mannosyl-transferase Tmtc3 n=1 Tax=Parasteatoda tepidariorum TaxID=114398 RepID=UPI00077FB492|nr:protein O-mannosyl-transferase Tmtc3 [Parasteatoda tepidariorum]
MGRFSRKKYNGMAMPFKKTDDEKPKKDTNYIIPAIIAISSFMCYANSLNCGLVFDDRPAIVENMDLRPKTALSNLLFNDFWGTPMHKEESHKSYRPLCVFTFRLNYWLHELNPFGYHFTNVALHVVVSLLYHRFCCEFLSKSASFIAAMLFGLHPIHTEAVTGVVGRAELLSSIFFLLAFRSYSRSRSPSGENDYRSLMCCIIFVGLAMLSKEQGITTVAVCAAYDILLIQQAVPPPLMPERAPKGKIKGPTPTWRKDLVLRLLVLVIGTAVLLYARMQIMGSKLPVFNKFDNPAATENWPTRHLTHHYLIPLNTWLLLYPMNLCCDWTMGTIPLVVSFMDSRAIATVFFYTVICKLVWTCYCSKNRIFPKLMLGVSMCIFPFVPASNLFYPVGFVIAERVLYLPSMGFCFLVACGWQNLCLIYRKRTTFLHACIVILLCLNFIKTVIRNLDWKDEESLFKSGLRFTKANAKLYNNLGHVMESKGEHAEALELFQQAVRIQPDDIGSYLNLGRIYNTLGSTEKAEQAFWQAKNLLPKKTPGKTYKAHIVPSHLDLFLNLGNLLSKNTSRLEEAQELYKEAISMKSDYIDAYMQRASVLLKLNRSEEAQDMYHEALKHDRLNPDLFYNIGVLLLEQGKSLQALARFDQALQIDPEHEKSLLNYAILIQDSGDSELRRIAHERLKVLLDKGQQPERTYFNLGMLAMQDRDAAKAELYFKRALQLKSDFDAALFNLALILYEKGQPFEALAYLQKLDKRHIKGLILLGNIYFNHLKNYTAALQCYKLILKQDPNHVPAMHNLCAAHYQLGELDVAEECLLHVSSLKPEESYVKHHLQIVQERKGKKILNDIRTTGSNPGFCKAPDIECHPSSENNGSGLPFSQKRKTLTETDNENLKL